MSGISQVLSRLAGYQFGFHKQFLSFFIFRRKRIPPWFQELKFILARFIRRRRDLIGF